MANVEDLILFVSRIQLLLHGLRIHIFSNRFFLCGYYNYVLVRALNVSDFRKKGLSTFDV